MAFFFVPISRMKHMKPRGRFAPACLACRLARVAPVAARQAGAERRGAGWPGFPVTRFVISSGARRARFGAGRAPAKLWISGTGPGGVAAKRGSGRRYVSEITEWTQ